jgi:LPS sulfotransferase NodH
MSPDSQPFTPFVILLQGRTGSTLLVECLDSHPLIQCDKERLVGFRKHGAEKQLQWTRQYLNKPANADVVAVGFKTKLEDVLDLDGFASILKSCNARIIVTQRRNLIKMIVSWFNSERIYAATGDWNVYETQHLLEPIEVDPEEFDRRLQLVVKGKERLDAFVKDLGLQSMSVEYEDLLLDQEKTIQKVCAHLNVLYHSMVPTCSKATPDDLRNVVVNFEKLRSCYRGSIYEPMFEEVLLR